MEASAHIRLWMGNQVPPEFLSAIGANASCTTIGESGSLELATGTVVFVAHVPAAVLDNPMYQRGQWPEALSGWLREGELGLFGTNALNKYAHPAGDGVLLVGSSV